MTNVLTKVKFTCQLYKPQSMHVLTISYRLCQIYNNHVCPHIHKYELCSYMEFKKYCVLECYLLYLAFMLVCTHTRNNTSFLSDFFFNLLLFYHTL